MLLAQHKSRGEDAPDPTSAPKLKGEKASLERLEVAAAVPSHRGSKVRRILDLANINPRFVLETLQMLKPLSSSQYSIEQLVRTDTGTSGTSLSECLDAAG